MGLDATIGVTMSEPVIIIDPEIMSGTPCFRGTRVPFKNLIDYLEGGHTLSEFLRQFPAVTHEMAVQALEERRTLPGPNPDRQGGDASRIRRNPIRTQL